MTNQQQNTAVTVAPSNGVVLATSVDSDDAANAALTTLFGGGMAATNAELSIAAQVEAVDSEGVNPFKLPVARVRDTKWDVSKSTPDTISRMMPVGDRPFTAIYLGYRVGGTGWKGKAKDGKGNPPVWAFALPVPAAQGGRALECAAQVRRVLHVANKVQFTANDQRTKFDTVGQLQPRIDVLVWTEMTGFIYLVVDKYQAVMDTVNAFEEAKIDNLNGKPLIFTIKQNTQTNKKKPIDDPRREWTTDYLKIAAAVDDEGQKLLANFQAAVMRDKRGVANTTLAFYSAQDFDGLSAAQIAEILAGYQVFGI